MGSGFASFKLVTYVREVRRRRGASIRMDHVNGPGVGNAVTCFDGEAVGR